MSRSEKPCTVLHDEFICGLHIVFLDVTDGAVDVLDQIIGRDILISVHRHPERVDGMKTYLAEELCTREIDFDWIVLERKLCSIDEAWRGFARLRSTTKALWSIVTPQQVWNAVREVKKSVDTSVRGTWGATS